LRNLERVNYRAASEYDDAIVEQAEEEDLLAQDELSESILL